MIHLREGRARNNGAEVTLNRWSADWHMEEVIMRCMLYSLLLKKNSSIMQNGKNLNTKKKKFYLLKLSWVILAQVFDNHQGLKDWSRLRLISIQVGDTTLRKRVQWVCRWVSECPKWTWKKRWMWGVVSQSAEVAHESSLARKRSRRSWRF